MPDPVRIPERLVRSALAWHGRGGARWLERLPALVRAVTARFDLHDVGDPFEPGGHASWCAPARTADGTDVVLKVQVPDAEARSEAAALRRWDGRSAVRLLDHDPDRWALVLERCRPGGSLLDLDDPVAAAIEGAAVAAALHAAGADGDPRPDLHPAGTGGPVALYAAGTGDPVVGAPDLGPVLAAWADEVEARAAVERRAGLDPGMIAAGVEALRTLPGSTERSVLLHGDLNPTNVLAAARVPWLAIDPKPMVGDPAWDGVRLVLQPDPARWPDPAAVLADRLAVVAEHLAVDRSRLAAWCLADAVQMVTSPDGGAVDHRLLGLIAHLAR